jgi:hypothetical protein
LRGEDNENPYSTQRAHYPDPGVTRVEKVSTDFQRSNFSLGDNNMRGEFTTSNDVNYHAHSIGPAPVPYHRTSKIVLEDPGHLEPIGTMNSKQFADPGPVKIER